MTVFKTVVFLLIVANSTDSSAGPLVQETLAKVFGAWTPYSNIRTIQFLNQLCNESQRDSERERDACYGCFFRATNQPSGYPMLLSMATCADTYLNNTDYGHCQRYLRNATNTITSRSRPNTIYCTFLECIRQVNKDTLIRECVGESVRMCSTFDNTETRLAQLFVNTTACILAKTRCGYMNPITGVIQEDEISNKLHLPVVNALQVNSNYDINIIQIPFTNGKGDECAKYRNIEQARWQNVEC